MIELRSIRDGDQEAFLEMLTDSAVNKTYMLPDFAAKNDAIPLFQRLQALSLEEKRFVRCISWDGKAVGFLNDVVIEDGKIELGYVIHPKHHNKGYMTAALKLAIAQLLEAGYQQVICGAFEGNGASLRVMEKSGMQPVPYSDTVQYRGKTHRCIYYATQKENRDAEIPLPCAGSR